MDNYVKVRNIKNVFLRDSLGSIDMCVDGSVESKEYYYTVPDNHIYYLNEVMVIIANATNSNNKYGDLSILPEGVEIFFRDENSNIFDLFDGVKIRKMSDLNILGCLDITKEPGVEGNDFARIKICFIDKTAGKKPIEINSGISIVFRINDDLRTLANHVVMLQGSLYNSKTMNFHV